MVEIEEVVELAELKKILLEEADGHQVPVFTKFLLEGEIVFIFGVICGYGFGKIVTELNLAGEIAHNAGSNCEHDQKEQPVPEDPFSEFFPHSAKKQQFGHW
jgi:hypothetical protein